MPETGTLIKSNLFKEFEAADAILRGHFILSSGLHSDTYLQCARVLMDTRRAERVCAALIEKCRKELAGIPFDIVVSPAMGGVVVGYEVARQLGVPSMFCERVEGEFTLRRGFQIEPGQRVLVVEDVITTGKSSLETFRCVEALGGQVVAEACLVDRTGGKAEAKVGVPVVSLLKVDVHTYAEEDLPEDLRSIPAIKPGSRWLQQKKA